MDRDELRDLWAQTLGCDPGAQSCLSQAATVRTPPQELAAQPGLIEHLTQQPPYTLEGELACGGMGRVMRAHQRSLARDVALKLIRNELRERPEVRRAFLAEALVLGLLEHPNIVPVHDLAQSDALGWHLSMKLIEGQTWEQRLIATPQELHFHLEVLLQVCNAVAYAHSRDIAHCDLKPDNIMLGGFGEVLVCDWGLAVEITASPRLPGLRHKSLVTLPCGTPHYMPPELARGDGPNLGPETDVYMLGGMLYRVLTGRPPHQASGYLGSVQKAVEARFDPLPPSVPALLRQACTTALQRNPEDRYRNAEAFQEQLRTYLRHRESLTISEQADTLLEDCHGDAARVQELPSAQRSQLYERFAAAVADFRQARKLWQANPRARAGEREARLCCAEAALQRGDLGVAETQLAALEDRPPDARVQAARQTLAGRLKARTRERRARLGLQLGLVGLLVLLALGAVAFVYAEQAGFERLVQGRRQEIAQRLRQLPPARTVPIVAEARALCATDWPAERRFETSTRERERLQASLDALLVLISEHQSVRRLYLLPIAGRGSDLAREPEHASLEAALQELRRLAVGVALRSASFELARALVREIEDPTLREEQLGVVREASQARLRWQLAVTRAALDDLGQGREREGRPSWEATPEELAARLRAFQHPDIAGLLRDALQPHIAHAAQARRNAPGLWSEAQREQVGVILSVLGNLEIPRLCVPALIAFAAVVWDRPLAIEAGLALCSTESPQALDFLVHELRPRFGPEGQVWAQVRRRLGRLPAPEPDFAQADAQSLVRQAVTLIELGSDSTALVVLARALQKQPNDFETLLLRARLALNREDLSLATTDVARLLELDPKSPDGWLLRALINAQRADLHAALADLDQAIAQDSLHFLALRSRGLVWHKLGHEAEAAADFTRAIHVQPDNPGVFSDRAVALQALGDDDGALRDFDHAATLDPTAAGYVFNRALLRRSLGDYPRALDDLTRAMRLRPGHAASFRERGRLHHFLGNREAALSDFERALAIEPGNPEIEVLRLELLLTLRPEAVEAEIEAGLARTQHKAPYFRLLGRLYSARGDPDAALQAYDQAVAHDPGQAEAYIFRAALHFTMRRFEAALADYSEAIHLLPLSAPLLASRGQVLGDLGRDDEALTAFDAALEIDPSSARARLQRAILLIRRGELEQAWEDLQRGAELEPDAPHTWTAFAHYHAARGDAEQALKLVTRALDLDAQYLAARSVRASVLVSLSRPEEALADFDYLVQRQPWDGETHQARGLVLWQLERPEEALASWTASIELQPEVLKTYYQRGTALLNLTRYEAAIEDLSRVIELDPDFSGGYYLRALCHYQRGDYPACLEDLPRAVAREPGNLELLVSGLALCQAMGDVYAARDGTEAAARASLCTDRAFELLASAVASGLDLRTLEVPYPRITGDPRWQTLLEGATGDP